jgi:hypothetical protein
MKTFLKGIFKAAITDLRSQMYSTPGMLYIYIYIYINISTCEISLYAASRIMSCKV